MPERWQCSQSTRKGGVGVGAGNCCGAGTLDLTIGKAAGGIKESAIGSNSNATTQCAEPRKLFSVGSRHWCRGERTKAGWHQRNGAVCPIESLTAPLSGRIEVRLNTEDIPSRLPVVADLQP